MSNLKNCSGSLDKAFGTGISMSGKTGLLLCTACITLVFFVSCGPSASEKAYLEDSKAIAESISAHTQKLETDTIQGITHYFVRTADLKMKVENALGASNLIEDLIAKKGGYISQSDLVSHINYSNSVKFKKDSVLESTYYTTSNMLSLRVPNKQLDTVLREISRMALFVDYRKLKADDVKMALFANTLSENRYRSYNARLEKIRLENKNNVNQHLNAEEKILEKQTLADNARVDQYDLADKVNYSTLVIELYQPELVHSQIIPVPPVVEPYSPSFPDRLKASFLKGLGILQSCVLFLTGSWGLILFLALLYVVFRKSRAFRLQKFYSITK